MSDRLTLSEALEKVGAMVDAVPNGRAAISDAYLGNMAALLCQYPRSIALRCADPLRGVVTKTPFVPTPHDVVKFCEPLTADMSRSAGRQDQIAAQLEERAELERRHPHIWQRAEPGANLKVDEKTGKHPPGTILANYDEAVRLYGRPLCAFEDGRERPYNSGRRS